MSAQLNIRAVDDVTVVGFGDRSKLDASTVDEISGALLGLVAAGSRPRIVLDMVDVHFVSSPALSLLLSLRRVADDAGGEVVLCALRSEVQRLLRITRLDKVFLSFDTLEAALAHFRPSA